MAFIFSDSPPFAFGSQFPVLSFQFSARTLLVQNDYKVARSGAQGHAIQCGQSLNLLNWRCNVYLQKGFLEILPFFPENKAEKVITITLWMEKWDVEKYEREVYPKVEEILKPYLVTPVTFKHYNVETTLCERFVETLAA